MGKLCYDPYIQHFSHPHPLELSNLQQQHPNLASCSGCKQSPSGWIYSCKACNYILHVSCAQMPQLIQHPADPTHALTLLSLPAYPEGVFNCDACGHKGNGFSYHCGACSLDIHIFCATKPLSLSHHAHPHTLHLAFFPPYQNKGFSCDICKTMGSNHWLYRCSMCEFDAHLNCAFSRTHLSLQPQIQRSQPVQIQQYQSFPQAVQPPYKAQAQFQARPQLQVQPQFQAQSQFQAQPQLQAPGAAGLSNGPPQTNCYAYNQNMATQQPMQQSGLNGTGNALMDAAIQGFITGASEQLDQDFMQNLTGGDNGGGGGGGGDGGDSSASVLDVG
uniref:Zinc finger PHD-type domain-containing protein n=1 Tax=Nelumbo nucifera TaxID=4432 RepID=A0A822YMC7_NELNU|nr:TPA_asm: hypothetical protein HUJ06_011310 [Nelumbo nucifera]